MSKRKPFIPEIEHQKIIALYEEGMSSRDIGKIYNCSGTPILKILHKCGIVCRTNHGDRTREKMSKAHTGKTLSEDHKKKISEGHLQILDLDHIKIHIKILELYVERNISTTDIGKLYGCSAITVIRILRKYDVDLSIGHKIAGRKRRGRVGPMLGRTGELSPVWRGGISFEPYGVEFNRKLKKSIRERDNYTCQICGQYGNCVHHIDYNKKNNSEINLIIACKRCHSKTNHNRETWMAHLQEIMEGIYK